MSVRGVALVKYGDLASSTRQRFLQYREYLECEGISLDADPLFGNRYLSTLFAGRGRRGAEVLHAYLRRGRRVFLPGVRTDFTWVHCEGFPYLPGIFERAILSGGPAIYDFDDAIFHQYDQHRSPLVRYLLGRKLEPLLRGADLAICGNRYLEAYAARFCRRTEIVPTVLDTKHYRPAAHTRLAGPMTVGWIGSPSTWTHLRPVMSLLQSLAQELDLRIRVVGAGPSAQGGPNVEFLDWSEVDEVAMIQGMDIGIMPLPDEPWARGKCGYKLIQYMACGLPVVASPVGVNAEIVEHGKSGFLARTETDWAEAIRSLAADPALRAAMGARGRARVEQSYSLHVHGPRLAAMVRDVVDRARYSAAERVPCAG